MDNDTLNSNPGATAPGAPAAPEVGATPMAEATPAAETAAPIADPAGTLDLTAPASEPSVTFPAPAGDTSADATSTSLVDTSAASAADPVAPATDTPFVSPNITPAADPTAEAATDAADSASAPANPLAATNAEATPGGVLDTSASIVNTNPILANAPEAKTSPILNSAPAVVKKFDLKYIIPIGVLAVIVVALAGFLIYEEMVGKPNAIQSARDAAKVEKTYVEAPEASETVAEDVPLVLEFESDQSLNTSDIVYALAADSNKGVTATASDDGTTVTFTVNWTDAKTAFADAKLSGTGTNDYSVEFSQAVSTIFYAGTLGGDDGDDYFLFLMEDGTVQYVDINSGLEAKEFSASRVSKAIDVVRFVSANSGSSTVALAQKSDGTYYDVSAIITD